MDRWNEICFLIKEHSKQNSKEAFFQNEVVNIFEKLGWSRFKKEIETEKNIPIGATKDLRLDILISLEGEKLFAVELKRATNPGSERISKQLISYMLQERMKFGLFIGENIQLFYDVPNDNKYPIKLIEIEFSENNEEGWKLIEILKREVFDEQKLIEYCNEKLLKIEEDKIKFELIDFLTSSLGNEYITQLILQDLKGKHGSKIIDELESKISIKISDKSSLPKIENLDYSRKNVSVVENPNEYFHNKIKVKNRSDKRTENGMKIGEFVQLCFRNAFEQGLISEVEINKLLNSEYSSQTFGKHTEILKHKNDSIYDKKGRTRYYAREIFCGNYYLSAQWTESQWDLLIDWLKKIGYSY